MKKGSLDPREKKKKKGIDQKKHRLHAVSASQSLETHKTHTHAVCVSLKCDSICPS